MMHKLLTRHAVEQTRAIASLAGVSMPSSKNLWDIVNRQLFENHDARHISDIWMEYHKDPEKQRVAAVITAPKYLKIAENAASSPTFVMPVFHSPESYENFILQFQMPHALFTSLEDFKRHGTSAAPHFSITYYRELMDSKGIVLLRGDILQPHGLDHLRAAALMHRAHDFYTDPQRHAMVHTFNHNPSQFNFARLLELLGQDASHLPT